MKEDNIMNQLKDARGKVSNWVAQDKTAFAKKMLALRYNV